MRGLLLALAVAVGVSATTNANANALRITPDQAHRAAAKVKQRERHNAYGMRRHIGGDFRLSAMYCTYDVRSWCRYDATAVLTVEGEAGYGMRHRCTVEVRMHLTAKGKVWKRRKLIACAEQLLGRP